ncbi:MAG: GNAT family N-acetyltransferase [Gammaproteobacteria bacterium]
MDIEQVPNGHIRKLWPTESEKFYDHLLRLDAKSRRMRFAHAVSDQFVREYAARMSQSGAVVYGCFDGDNLVACAELRKIGDTWGHTAEAAFSVEPGYQDKGIGSELLGRVIRAARNRGVRHLVLICLADNAKMQAVARHHDAELHFDSGEVIGDIVPRVANPMSIFAEAFEDRVDMWMAVFDLKGEAAKAA